MAGGVVRLAAWLVLSAAAPAAVSAQTRSEVQVHGLATFADQRLIGAGVGAGVRSPARWRLSAGASGGDLGGRAAGRLEVLATYHLEPLKRRGVALYGGGGLALLVSDGMRREYAVLLLGAELAPGRPAGWFAEAGVGGGVRVAAGVRFRTGSRNRRPYRYAASPADNTARRAGAVH